MIDTNSTDRFGLSETFGEPAKEPSVRSSEHFHTLEWSRYHEMDLASILKQNSELSHERSRVIELAVDRYKFLRERYGKLDIDQYCKTLLQFDHNLNDSIKRQIEVEYAFAEHFRKNFGRAVTWPEVGERIHGFRILEQLGSGSFSRVFVCAEEDLGDRQVVVKVSQRGAQEANILGKLQHPNIMPVHSISVGDDSGLSYLCTPFLGRSTLRDLTSLVATGGPLRRASDVKRVSQMKAKRTDNYSERTGARVGWLRGTYEEAVFQIIGLLADALAHAHQHGILHGDLKPSNVLLTNDGEPILLDFNLSGNVGAGTGVMGGTIAYMSPEQEALTLGCSDGVSCDERSDIYSLGIILLELLVGRGCSQNTVQEMRPETYLPQKERCDESQQYLRSQTESLDDSLRRILDLCLAPDARDRFASMGDLSLELSRELSIRKVIVRRLKKYKKSIASIACIGMILIIGLVTWLSLRPPYHERMNDLAIASLERGDVEEAMTYLGAAISAEPDFFPARYSRGRAWLSSGKTMKALEEFTQISQDRHHPPSMAQAAYCFNLTGQHSAAISWYERAVDAGYVNSGVHNNLAASYIIGRSVYPRNEALGRARSHLEKGLTKKDLPQLRWNLVLLASAQVADDPKAVPAWAVEHLTSLQSDGFNHLSLYQQAVRIYAALARTDKDAIAEGIGFLLRGVGDKAPFDLNALAGIKSFDLFEKHPRYGDLVEVAANVDRVEPTIEFSRFVDPADDQLTNIFW